jgi:hypothetical protein
VPDIVAREVISAPSVEAHIAGLLPDCTPHAFFARGEFQVTKYGLIATPYCADEEIARVANSYGWHREAAAVRTNPLSKVYICQTLGWDWRL